MAGQSAIVRKHHLIADRAIVANVTVGEKIATASNPRFAVAGCAPIDGNEFTEGIFVTDFQICRLTRIFEILCLLADRAIRVELVAGTGVSRSAKRNMML